MEILRVIGIGIVGAITVTMLKTSKSEVAIVVSIATGIVIILSVMSIFGDTLENIESIIEKTHIEQGLYSGIIKIVGIGYIVEYSSSICDDFDCKSISSKIKFAGKVTIFALSLPIFNSVINVICEIIY